VPFLSPVSKEGSTVLADAIYAHLVCTVRLLQKYTLPTQMVTGGITSAAGDLTYQLAIQNKEFKEIEVNLTSDFIILTRI